MHIQQQDICPQAYTIISASTIKKNVRWSEITDMQDY